MTTEAELFDGTVLEFPDGTSPDVIQRTVKAQTAARRAANPDPMAAAPPAAPAPAAPQSTLTDVAESLPSGVARGAVETAMLPATAARGAAGIGDWLFDRADNGVRSLFGLDPIDQAARDKQREGMRPLTDLAGAGQGLVRQGMDAVLHKPTTTAGKYAETIGEFAAPGGLPSKATRMAPTMGRMAGEYGADVLRGAVVPGVMSEGLGQATEGTWAEGPARIIGAIMGNGLGAAGRAYHAPEQVLRRAAGPAGDIDWQGAMDLQNNGTGIRLTGPEAITQGQGGASGLPNVQRLVEGSIEGRAKTAPFFAERPAQVDTAVGNTLDQIAPQAAAPSVLGPRASDAATRAIRDVEQQRTDAVEPFYRAADPTKVPEGDVSTLLDELAKAAADDKTGIMSGPLGELRKRLTETPGTPGTPGTRTPVVGANGKVTRYTQTPATPATPATPITDIENLDRARKYFRDKLDLPQIGQDAITKEQGAAINDILQRLDDMMVQASPDFAAGKQEYATLSRDLVQPVAEGPLGRVAAAKDTTAAGGAILPQNPLTGSANEASDAVKKLLGQDADTTRGLVRQNLSDRYAKAATETQGGDREFAGAKFRKDVAGNKNRQETLDAVLEAIQRPAAKKQMTHLLDVLGATGQRKPIGSATAFNATGLADLGAGDPVSRLAGLLRSGGTSIITGAQDSIKRAGIRNSVEMLADMFTDPHSVELIRAALTKSFGQNVKEGSPRFIAQAAGQSAVADSHRRDR